eukprot:2786258-Pyramimonas_sp.AAC.1
MSSRSATLGKQDGQTHTARTGIAMRSDFLGAPTCTFLQGDEEGKQVIITKATRVHPRWPTYNRP